MDSNLKSALQQIVDLSTEIKIGLALDSFKKLIPEIKKYFDDRQTVGLILAIFASSVAADGKISGEEFALVKSFFMAMEIDMADEDIVKMLADIAKDGAYDAIKKLNQVLSAEGRAYLVSLVAAICAIDDRIAPQEVSYLSDLYEGNV